VSGEIPAEKVLETDQIVVIRDIRAQAPKHLLLIPRKHIATLAEVENSDAALLGALMLTVRDVAAKEGVSSGFRLVANNGETAGQSVFHIHFHLLAGRQMGWPPG
jgi:diadenosine tetraphosphate (Ap4A) HIT family hydrolase